MSTKAAERVKEKVSEIKDAYQQGKNSARHMAEAAVETSREAVSCADEWTRENAWKLLAATLAMGIAVGLLCRLRSPESDSERIPR